jgi:DNA-binding MltR family transcriptional regulator
MAWIGPEEDQPIIDEIERQTDRAAALIAQAYMEQRLLNAIKAPLENEDDIQQGLFRPSGPLGSFSSRIDLARLLGIIEPRIHKTLHVIREIRNEFAHKPQPRDFNFPRIKDLCANIDVSLDIRAHNRTTDETYRITLRPDGSSRTAFMKSIKLLLFCLSMEINRMPPRRPAPPAFAELVDWKP